MTNMDTNDNAKDLNYNSSSDNDESWGDIKEFDEWTPGIEDIEDANMDMEYRKMLRPKRRRGEPLFSCRSKYGLDECKFLTLQVLGQEHEQVNILLFHYLEEPLHKSLVPEVIKYVGVLYNKYCLHRGCKFFIGNMCNFMTCLPTIFRCESAPYCRLNRFYVRDALMSWSYIVCGVNVDNNMEINSYKDIGDNSRNNNRDNIMDNILNNNRDNSKDNNRDNSKDNSNKDNRDEKVDGRNISYIFDEYISNRLTPGGGIKIILDVDGEILNKDNAPIIPRGPNQRSTALSVPTIPVFNKPVRQPNSVYISSTVECFLRY